MDKLIIRGGERLVGEVAVSGAKNSVLPLACACLLTDEPLELSNVPALRDVRTVERLLATLGVETARGEGTLRLCAREITGDEAPYELVKTMRASVLVLGPLVARHGRARVSLPGGCAIGARPIDQHLKGLEALGIAIRMEHGYVVAEAQRPVGGRVLFDLTTVTGTENVLMAAVLARGETVIENAACEPEVKDLADALGAMGAKIEGAGSERILVQGVDRLHGTAYAVMPDRIETGTLMAAAAMTRGNVLLHGANPAHLESVIGKIEAAGARVAPEEDGLRVVGPSQPTAVDVKTSPYPGFATDMQAQMMALTTIAQGMSVIAETIFENRFMHVLELQRLGADIRVEGRSAVIRGRTRLSGAPVMATDLRASASLVLAGLVADGLTEVSRVYHLDRGYERLDEKLARLGADIRRVPE